MDKSNFFYLRSSPLYQEEETPLNPPHMGDLKTLTLFLPELLLIFSPMRGEIERGQEFDLTLGR
jgi:hypothetical protein